MTTKLTDRTNGIGAGPSESVNGRYRILDFLGEGAQGGVYKVADQFGAGRIKVLKALVQGADPKAVERLRWEFVRLARLDHPRLLRVFDLDVADGTGPLEEGQLFFTAEFSGGRHPTEIISKLGKRRRVELLWRIAIDVASALDHIHGKGLLHGDVKPENLLCTSHGDVKLIDLGLSTVAGAPGTDEVAGTLEHLAPEGLAGVPDERADLYGLGSTLYFLASGRLARGVSGDQPLSVTIGALMEQEPEPLHDLVGDLPMGFCKLVDSLVARDPDDRPRAARVLLEQIARTRRTVSLALSDDDEGLPLLAAGLVGRSDLVRDVRRVVGARLRSDAARSGRPAVVVLRGDEGAGRNATVAEVIRQVQLKVAGGELTSPRVAMGATLAQAVRPLLPGTPPSLVDGAALAEMLSGLEGAVSERPMVIVVQDADSDAQVLRRLFLLLRRDPRIVLGRLALVVRASEGLALEADGVALGRTLPPLTTPEVQILVNRCLGVTAPAPFVEQLRAASGGAPGLLLELLRAAWAEVGDRRQVADVDVEGLRGEGLCGVAAARLANLPDRERHLALALAVAGEAIPLDWAARLVDLTPLEAWEALELLGHHGVVAVDRGQVRLAHPSYAEALATAPEEVSELHGRLARQYGDLAETGDEAALTAQVNHLAAAGTDPALPDLAREAAHRSGLRGQWAQAARLLVIARQSLSGGHRRATTRELAMALVRSGAYDEGLAELDGLGDGSSAAQQLQEATVRGLALQRQGSLVEARDVLSVALSVLESGQKKIPTNLMVEARIVLGRVLLALGDLEAAEALCPEVSSAPETADGLGLLEIGGLARYYAGELEGAQTFFDRAADRAKAEDPARLSRALGFAGMVHQTAGRLGRAERCYEEAGRLAAEQHDLHGAALYAGNLGGVLKEQGKLAEALEPSVAAVRRMIQLGRTAELPAYVFNLGNLLLALGDLDGAFRELTLMATEAERVGAPFMRGYMLLLGSDLLRRADQAGRRSPDLPEALSGRRPARLAREAAEVFGEIGASREQAYACIAELECWAAEGRPERAGSGLAQLDTLLKELDDPLVTHHASLARGRLGLAGAPGHQSDQDLADASDFFADGHGDLAWRVEVVRGGLALVRGDEGAARRLLASASLKEQVQRDRLPEAYQTLRDGDADLILEARLRRQCNGVGGGGEARASGSERVGREPDAVQLRRLLSINQRINSERRLPILLELVLDAVLELTDAERGFILLLTNNDVLEVRIARNMAGDGDGKSLAEGDFSLSQSIAEQAARQGEAVITVDAAMDERFSDAVSVHGLRIRSVMAVPLRVKGRVVGTVYMDNRLRRGAFSEGDLALVRDFAQQAAIAIENARLHEELQARQEEIERLNVELASKVARQEAEIQDMRTELRQNQAALQVRYDYSNIVGATPRMTELFHLLDRITDVELPVVIHGESGTGKELVARAIHVNGPRAEHPFVSENCGAVPETLLESILFGHVKGAFTGAQRDKRGLFEVAHGGTLFLDEVGEMSPGMQTKLLRVLQNGEVRRVGGDKVIQVDVRILAASNQNLSELVESKQFRQDLFYRLNVLQVVLPPLRKRAADVPLLVEHFLAKHSPDRPRRVARAAMDCLMAYGWPGNVRELENEIQRALALGGDLLGVDDLTVVGHGGAQGQGRGLDPDDMDLRSHVEVLERDLLQKALERTGYNQTRSAALLGLSRFGLLKKLKRYGMLRTTRKTG
jgi:transcriptional regulator with GAF, ATPase, and Fis domain/tetratricopeptide (TPR) repeat protein